ncbi:DSD1 family PLP-dependent enzyme [Enterovirga sp. CN4-39]|uniref:DSD1 family PLP-dependent enzyme n=1 Tax=Enterovirga sp. CN4-39 TaxID=3400910 RepID=UPI003C08672D
MSIDEIDTPALIVDLGAFDRNIAKMAGYVASAGIGLRAHAKTHKSSAVARRQMAAGAVGQCVQKVGEAEVLAAAGIPDILVSNQVVDPRKLDRLAALARGATIGICFDDLDQVSLASAAATKAGVTLNGFVEIEVGMARCGVAPGRPAAELARRIADAPGLRFEGLQAYHGRAQHLPTAAEREAAIHGAIGAVRDTQEALGTLGLEARTVSGAGTGTFRVEAESGVYTELQAGSYAFMDLDYAAIAGADGRPYDEFEHSLFVLSGVISVSGRDWFVVDAGLKSYSGEKGPPRVHRADGWTFLGMSDEHGKIGLSAGSARPKLGDKVALIPGHCDPTINLHDWYVGVRNGRVEEIWPIDARGASR